MCTDSRAQTPLYVKGERTPLQLCLPFQFFPQCVWYNGLSLCSRAPSMIVHMFHRAEGRAGLASRGARVMNSLEALCMK